MLEPERILRLEEDAVVLLDQRLLPLEEVEVRCETVSALAVAIETMVVRGAPAIGVAAAYGIAGMSGPPIRTRGASRSNIACSAICAAISAPAP